MSNKDRAPEIVETGKKAIARQLTIVRGKEHELASAKEVLRSLIEMHDFITLEILGEDAAPLEVQQ